MFKRGVWLLIFLLGLGLLLTGCAQDLTGFKSGENTTQGVQLSTQVNSKDGRGEFVILFESPHTLPPNTKSIISTAGGTLVRSLEDIGVAIAKSDDPNFASTLNQNPRVKSVQEDIKVQWTPKPEDMKAVSVTEAGKAPPPEGSGLGDEEPLFGFQWNMRQIEAPGAWDVVGETGSPSVQVAVLDTGVDYTHPDLKANIDMELSTSFVDYGPDAESLPPGDPMDLYGHGTHVSGIVAAAANGVGVIGVAPEVTIVAVKVLCGEGWGTFGSVISGIVYAANVDTDVINMSLGAYFPRRLLGAGALLGAMSRAVNYAHSQGTIVIASAGNEATNLNRDKDYIVLPAQAGTTVSVAATGPVGQEDFDSLASYSNYGLSGIDVTAPGGDFQLYPQEGWYLDMVLSTWSSQSLVMPAEYVWAAGTSMASPHTAGVAALIASHFDLRTAGQVEEKIEQTAEDLGRVGVDNTYGEGRINAYNAVK